MTTIEIDLTIPAVTWESCYQKIADDSLAHQLQLRWTSTGHQIVARCNCGAVVGVYRPETAHALDMVQLGYEQHVVSLL